MDDNVIERRHLLRNAGLVAGGAAAVSGLGATAMPASADDDGHHGHHGHHGTGLLGSWLVDVRNADGSTSVSILSFAAGGVAIVHDISPAGPPFTGSWESGARDSWQATVWTGFPGETGPGSPGSTIKLRLRGTVDKHRMRGSFVFASFDPEGSEVGRGSGTFRGRRVEA
jgi:hypothetical protein